MVRKAPSFYIKENAAIRKFIDTPSFRMFFLEEFSRNFAFLEYFKRTDYMFVQLAWHAPPSSFNQNMSIAQSFENIDPQRVIFLANTEWEAGNARQAGFKAIYCNHNAWIDERVFKLGRPLEEKIYDLVLNTRPEGWKRPFLARKVKPLALIKGYNFRPNDYFELKSLEPAYINEARLQPADVVDILGRAFCGGSFSEEEGACYSSSEMLLTGLPVISTKSRGGRDVWYTPDNSVIVEPDEEAVRVAAADMKQKLLDGVIAPVAIRQAHIDLASEFRQRFLETVHQIVQENGEDPGLPQFSGSALFGHKMVNYVPAKDVAAIFA
jgi:hypothetical protein